MIPEGTVIDGGLGAVAVVSVGFTMCTDGVTVGCIPNALPRRPSSRLVVEPKESISDAYARHTPTSAFDPRHSVSA